MEDPYKILGIERNASSSDIKKAYRKLAIKHHPDKGGDAEKFKQVSGAYDILSNKQKKMNYDKFGSMDSVSMDFDPMEIFNQFNTMFNKSGFLDPTNITTHQFSGFSNHSGFSNNTDLFNGLLGNMGNFNMGNFNMGNGNMSSFSQTTVIKNGKKITTTNQNGEIIITEEILGGHDKLR